MEQPHCDQCPSQGEEIRLAHGKYELRARLCPKHRDEMIDHFEALKQRVNATNPS